MPKSLERNRHAVWLRQEGRCHYCRCHMWEQDVDAFAASRRLTRRQAKWCRSTAEHLVARSDGGTNASSNIAAACLRCNQTRHKAASPLNAERFLVRVRRLMAKGRWWPRELHRLVL